MGKKGRKTLNGCKKKKNKENKRDGRQPSNAMEVTDECAIKKKNAKKNKKNAPLVLARPKGPKGTRQNTTVTEVKVDNMKRIQAIYRAHKTFVTQITLSNGIVYTGGQDGFLSTWVTRKDLGPISLERRSTKDVGGSISSLLVRNDTIFCGLHSGSIKMFSADDRTLSLESHDKRVTALLEHQGVLISGSFDGTVKMWKIENGIFVCKQTVTMAAEVRTLLLTSLESVVLWVGTNVGLYVLNLQNLDQPPVKIIKDCHMVVTCLVEHANHVLVGFRNGSLHCFGKNGELQRKMEAYPDCKCLNSINVIAEGSRLICGFNDGRVSSIALHQFERKARWDAFDRVNTTSVCACGDGYYIIGSQAGDLHLWQHDDTDEL